MAVSPFSPFLQVAVPYSAAVVCARGLGSEPAAFFAVTVNVYLVLGLRLLSLRLEQLPLTRIKLDRSLIASIDSNPRSAAIARAIMGLCQGLGLEITAEGVERPEQFALLSGHRGMYMQGYLLARPAPAGDLEAMMRTVQQKCEELLVLQKAAAMESTIVDLMPVLPRRAAN